MATQKVFLYFCFLILIVKCSAAGKCERLVDDTANSTCYDKDLRPNFGSAQTVADRVGFGIHVYQIGPISESSMSINSDLYVRMFWNDTRLSALAERLSANSTDDDTVMVKGHYAQAIWRPNIYFVDAVEEHTPSELSQSKVTLLRGSGEVLASNRILIKTRCPLDLSMFPVDTQVCPICFSSYMYNDAEQYIYWKDENVDMRPSLHHTATFDIDSELKHYARRNEWMEGEKQVSFTTLCLEVRFNRKFKIYIVTMFLPSISLVLLSWVSFCIDKNAVPARAGITITTILAQITLITGTANKFPGIADLKIGDVYMIGNFFFVFGSLIEFAIVNTGSRKKNKKMKKGKCTEEVPQSVVCEKASAECQDNGNGNASATYSAKGQKERSSRFQQLRREPTMRFITKKRDIDFYALILFPLVFLIWNASFILFCLFKAHL